MALSGSRQQKQASVLRLVAESLWARQGYPAHLAIFCIPQVNGALYPIYIVSSLSTKAIWSTWLAISIEFFCMFTAPNCV